MDSIEKWNPHLPSVPYFCFFFLFFFWGGGGCDFRKKSGNHIVASFCWFQQGRSRCDYKYGFSEGGPRDSLIALLEIHQWVRQAFEVWTTQYCCTMLFYWQERFHSDNLGNLDWNKKKLSSCFFLERSNRGSNGVRQFPSLLEEMYVWSEVVLVINTC